ncbi:MAG: hypothetical protein HBSAPP04_18880 [Ignavibacteriaceae bacterium]|nr:MAG: hypothetical protein HBSAPP04_18880 [Ignavibacteriaceae bacterium]
MVSKMRFCLLLLFILPGFADTLAQDQAPVDPKMDKLNKIYRNLEYNTSAFDDLREKWIVIDPVLVRAVFNKFLVSNALRIDGKKPKLDFVKEKVQDIYKGEVFIDLRKRYYDDEIDLFRFYSEDKILKNPEALDFFFDPVEDYVRIQDIVGQENYNLLKAQRYAFNDVSKTYYDEKLAYKFDINFSMLDPYLTFYNFTTNDKNKYLISAFGRWGYDNIAIPGWFSPALNAGIRVTYIDRILNNRPNDVFTFDVGMGIPVSQPFVDKLVPHGKRHFMTGQNIYINLKGNFLRYAGDYWKDYDILLEGSFSLNTFEPGQIKHVSELSNISSVRNYFNLGIERRNFVDLESFGFLGAALGFGLYDVQDYTLDPSQPALIELPAAGGKSKFFVQAQGIISKDDALFAYTLAPTLFFNTAETNLYYGFNLSFLISNSFGFTFKFYNGTALGSDPLPGYRGDTYVVFSPIIRINY